MRDALGNLIALDMGATPDTFKLFLLPGTITATIDTDDSSGVHRGNAAFGTEVTGTNWTVPDTLVSPAITSVAGVGVKFDADDVSVASTTISTAVYGCAIYDSTIDNSVGPVVVVVYFGGSSYTTNNGTFGITWDGNGIYRITLHP